LTPGVRPGIQDNGGRSVRSPEENPAAGGGFSFLLGATSYVVEAGLPENARFLRSRVDDMELVLFHTPEASNLPSEEEIGALAELASDGFGYTVHLPLDIPPGVQSYPLSVALEVIESTLPLAPRAFVVHLDARSLSPCPSMTELTSWRNGEARALAALAGAAGDPSLIAVENLERWPPEWFLPMIDALQVGLTVDVGHLWVQQRDPVPYLEQWLPKTKVVHIHGVSQTDHVSLEEVEEEDLKRVLGTLRGFRGVLTLEVFGMADFESSLRVVKGMLG